MLRRGTNDCLRIFLTRLVIGIWSFVLAHFILRRCCIVLFTLKCWWTVRIELRDVLLHISNERVESSSRWISASSRLLSSFATRLLRRSTQWRPLGRRRSGSSRDSHRTTKHLCTSLHRRVLNDRRCPGLECWTCVHDGAPKSYLCTGDVK